MKKRRKPCAKTPKLTFGRRQPVATQATQHIEPNKAQKPQAAKADGQRAADVKMWGNQERM